MAEKMSFFLEIITQFLKIIENLDLICDKCVKLFANEQKNCLSFCNVENFYLPIAKLRFLIKIWYEKRPKTGNVEKCLIYFKKF